MTTLNQIRNCLDRLVQKQADPPRIIVVWPDDDLAAIEAAAKPNDIILRVVYDDVSDEPTND